MSIPAALAAVLLAPAAGAQPGPQSAPAPHAIIAPLGAERAGPQPVDPTPETAGTTADVGATPIAETAAPPPADTASSGAPSSVLAAAQTGDLPTASAEAAISPAADRPPQDDVVVTARPRGDPLRAVNRQSFAATQAVDEAITGPAALAYKRIVPDPVRSGLRNFMNNLHEPNVAINYLIQLKPGKAAETVGRFALNSTIGVAGLFDVAKRKPFRLPRRPNGFADTLGFYGIRPGPFFFVPLVGPTTARDFLGGTVDRLLGLSFLRGAFAGRAYVLSTAVVRILDRRAESDDRARTVRASADPYETRRAIYMHKREDEIARLHGRRAAPSASPPGAPGAPPTPAPDPAAEMPLPSAPIATPPAVSES